MSNKNKAAKSKESKQRTKAANKNRQQARYDRNNTVDIIQRKFLRMVTDKPYIAEEAICHGTS